jgi:pentapeptide MXKDX repeat protein
LLASTAELRGVHIAVDIMAKDIMAADIMAADIMAKDIMATAAITARRRLQRLLVHPVE